MEAEVLIVIMDDNDRVLEMRGSQELFDKMDAQNGGKHWPGVTKVVQEPEKIKLELPEIDEGQSDGQED